MVKLGWTTWSLFDNEELIQKIKIARKKGIAICLGGSSFEIAYSRGEYDEFIYLIKKLDLNSIEIGSGFAVKLDDVPSAVKKAKNNGLSVMVEIGYKELEQDNKFTLTERLTAIKKAIEAGADYIILEAREIGTGYSVFKAKEKENKKLLKAILSLLPLNKIIFEAPHREQQVWLIKKLGPSVYLGNIPFDEIPRVETFRRKLHADTFSN